MSAATDFGADFLSAVEFSPATPCEHSLHLREHDDEPAAWFVVLTCDGCAQVVAYLLCESGRVRMASEVLRCPCGQIGFWADWCLVCEPLGAGS